MNEFKPGDVVGLRSNTGPAMVVGDDCNVSELRWKEGL